MARDRECKRLIEIYFPIHRKTVPARRPLLFFIDKLREFPYIENVFIGETLIMPVYIWYSSLGGLALGFIFMNIPPVADQFMAMYGVGHGGLSLLLSGTIWAHALCQIPVGLLTDRIPPRLAALLACVLAVVSGLLPLAAPTNLTLAVVCRFLGGVCTALLYLATMKMITLLAPPGEHAKAQGIYGGMIGFGNMLPYIVLPLFGASGRVWSHALMAALYALTGIALLWVPKVALPKKASADAGEFSIRHVLKTVLFSPTMLAIGVVHGFIYGTLNNTGQWLPSILADLSGRPIADWALASMLILLVGSCARLGSGYLLRFSTMSGLVLTGLALLAGLYIVLGLMPTPGLAIAAGLALAVACSMGYGAMFGLTIRSFNPVYIGVCFGYQTTLANFVYVGLTLLYGVVRDQTSSFAWAQIAAGLAAFAALGIFGRRIRRIG